jgi:hypothetical protein
MMRQLAVAVFVAVVLPASPAGAAIISFQTPLVPEVAGSTGSGTALVTYDSVAHTLDVFFSWSGLTGMTTVAHIHCCTDAPSTVGVATYPGTFPGFPFGLMAGTYSSPVPIDLTLLSSYTGGPTGFLNTFGGGTAAGAEAALLAGLLAGRAYLNVHSSFAPGGEIRGFLTEIQPATVPEPGTLTLIGVGVAALAARRRRRQRS